VMIFRMRMMVVMIEATLAEKMKTADVADRLARLKPVGHAQAGERLVYGGGGGGGDGDDDEDKEDNEEDD
jgi:hypothetical protein